MPGLWSPQGHADPGEDLAAIFDALPPAYRAQFRAEYDEALDAAHDLARFKQVQLMSWSGRRSRPWGSLRLQVKCW
ncbi:DUF6247 family protein [Spongiactinospora sp. 9N601]|uniref:DUF6247 family protein n=1 Tax=Spongiactinospora sp. 9N601 TaxID=3375149 RepID=UPI003790A096